MAPFLQKLTWLSLALSLFCLLPTLAPAQDEPPALNPFTAPNNPTQPTRDDAVPGYIQLSDGSTHPGHLYLTRDARLRLYDAETKRQREVPLSAISEVDCRIAKEWLEPEWRFKENANDQKFYTGRSYPAREYNHVITLKDGRTLSGPLSAIVYVEEKPGEKPTRFLLHKRDKGPVGTDLKSLLYVQKIALGQQALDQAAPARDTQKPAASVP